VKKTCKSRTPRRRPIRLSQSIVFLGMRRSYMGKTK
jgi:hypothetical protein